MLESSNYRLNRGKSPYKVEVAPGYVQDPMPGMEQAFKYQRAEQENLDTQRKAMIGNLDSLDSDFINLFRTLVNIREKLTETKRNPIVTNHHLIIIRKILSSIDKVNGRITKEIIPLLDKLGR